MSEVIEISCYMISYPGYLTRSPARKRRRKADCVYRTLHTYDSRSEDLKAFTAMTWHPTANGSALFSNLLLFSSSWPKCFISDHSILYSKKDPSVEPLFRFFSLLTENYDIQTRAMTPGPTK